MIQGHSILDINQSWLSFWNDALTQAGIPFCYHLTQPRTSSGQRNEQTPQAVTIFPLDEWRVSNALPDTLEANFQLQVTTSLSAGEALNAFSQNLTLQAQIHDFLFNDARTVSGYSTGGVSLYAVPLLQFNERGVVISTIHSTGIHYTPGASWKKQSTDIDAVQCWLLEIPVTVTL